MATIYLNDLVIFSYKKTLFVIGKIGVIKIKLPNNLSGISFYLGKSCIKIVTSNLNKLGSLKLIQEISKKINKILIESNISFSNKIMIFGIGFRSWAYKANNGFKYLVLKIGFSKDLSIKIPLAIEIIILKPTLILFRSLDKNILNEFVSFLRSLKVPDSYKGKGLRYVSEKILLKVGKT